MGKNTFTRSYGRLKIGDNEEVANKNYFTDERLQEQLFNNLVNGTYPWTGTTRPSASTTFLRPGQLRYTKPNVLSVQGAPEVNLYWSFNNSGYLYQLAVGTNVLRDSHSDPKKSRYDYTGPLIPSSNPGYSFGGLSINQNDDLSGIPNSYDGGPGLPTTRQQGAAISWVDVPGTQIGNLFKHPPGRAGWFNEVGVVALSQGNVEIRGPYAPDESRMAHMGYQVYYTKSGGSGRPLTPAITGTAGQTTAGLSTFTDASGPFLASHASSGNHYIRINSGASKGTFKIKTFVDANTVIVDASDVYVEFESETGIQWEMVTGPIGEYFFRKRSYFTWDNWGSNISYNNSNFIPLTGLQREVAPLQNTWASSTKVIHDRGACWWALANNGNVPLIRWVHNSPQSFEPMHTSGKISGLSSWPFLNEAVRDIAIDLQNNIWIVGDPANSSSTRDGRVSTLKINPYPGGNAAVPSLLGSYSGDMTALANSSNPLGANDIRAVVCDNTGSNGLGTSRVWLIPGPSHPLNGLSYTDDYGTTWSRIHVLHSRTGTASVASGSTLVTGSGTLFQSEFAVGDWIRFSGDDRSYRIQSISSDTSLALSTPHSGGVTDTAILRGGLANSNIACTSFLNGLSNDVNALTTSSAPADYDSSGNIFWISADRNYVVKWDNNAGKATALEKSTMSSPVSFENGGLFSLTVHRIPDSGSISHPLKDYIWVGSRVQGMTLVHPVFDGTHTRYDRTLSNSWPTTMNIPHSESDSIRMPRAVINYKTGSASIFCKYRHGAGTNSQYHYEVNLGSADIGKLVPIGTPTIYQHPWWSGYSTLWCTEFDEVGIGCRALINPTYRGFDSIYDRYSGSMAGSQWLPKRWYDGQWNFGPVNARDTDINFRNELSPAGPYTEMDFFTGNGSKRMHPDWQVLDEDTGLQIRFVDTDVQTVAQEQQFLADENTTFVCWIGQGKDNTQTAQYGVDYYTAPTVVQMQTETDKPARNIWTQNGGVEGGYSTGQSGISHRPPFYRGMSMPADTVPHGGSPYPNLSGDTFTSGSGYHQYSAALRLNPYQIVNPASDGATLAGTTKFTSAVMVFDSSHIGKSLFIKGASSNPDNGQAIIKALVPGDPTSVLVDKTFVNTRTSLSWKMLDVPVVSYVVFPMDLTLQGYAASRVEYTLYSSKNSGATWDQVKFIGTIRGATLNSDLTAYQDSGVYFGHHDYLRSQLMTGSIFSDIGFYVVFDLRSLDEDQRRRQHWKLRTFDTVRDSTRPFRGLGLHLYDSNMNFIGVPSNCMIDLGNDPDFKGAVIEEASELALKINEEIYTGYPAVQGNYVDTVFLNPSSTSSFCSEPITGEAEVSGTTFSIVGEGVYEFTPRSVGKHIKISDATATANNGFATITGYIDPYSVTMDKTFVSESETFSWSIVSFAPGDRLRVSLPNYKDTSLTGANLGDTTFEISDVIDTRTIKLVSASYPAQASGISGGDIRIEKYPGPGDQYLGNYIGAVNPSPPYDAQNRWSYSSVFGTLAWSEKHEFITLQSDVLTTASSSSGVDGDAFTDEIVLNTIAVTEADSDDYIILESATLGRRVFEIRNVTRNSPSIGQTTLQLYYDEVPASQSFSWRIVKTRNKTFSYPKVLTTTR